MIRVVGYSTLHPKPRGNAGIVYFKPADQIVAEAPPSADDLRKHVVERGYGVRAEVTELGLLLDQRGPACDPVYVYEE